MAYTPEPRYAGPINEALCVVPVPANTSNLWHAAAGFRGLESTSTNFPTTIWGIASKLVLFLIGYATMRSIAVARRRRQLREVAGDGVIGAAG